MFILKDITEKYSGKYTILGISANEPSPETVSNYIYVVRTNGKVALRFQIVGWKPDAEGEPDEPLYDIVETQTREIADIYFSVIANGCDMFTI